MPQAKMSFQTTINVPQDTVFAYVTDLTRHGEWAGNELLIEPTGEGTYKSVANVGRLQFNANLTEMINAPPHRWGFKGSDSTGNFEHTFTFEPFESDGEGTKVTRNIAFDLSLVQWIMFNLLYFPVRRPAGLKSMTRLKQQLEKYEV